MKCDSEVKFGVGRFFLPIKRLFGMTEIGNLVSKIWSGIAFYILRTMEIQPVLLKENNYESDQSTYKK